MAKLACTYKHDGRRKLQIGGERMPNIGVPGLILILVIALIVFGPAKLPQLGRAVGETLREFKSSTKELMSDDDATDKTNDTKETKKD